jgi:hypothetical protein
MSLNFVINYLNKGIIHRYYNLISSTMQNTSVWMMPFCGGVKVFGEGSRDCFMTPTGLPMCRCTFAKKRNYELCYMWPPGWDITLVFLINKKASLWLILSSLHTYHTDDDVDDLGTDDVNDLVGKLIKKAMEKKLKKSGGKATSNALRLSNRPRGKGDIDKECSCGCEKKPSDKNCPGCGSVNSKITMACWMKGQVCQLCKSKNQRKTVV